MYIMRLPTQAISLADMNVIESESPGRNVVAKRETLDGRPVSEFKYRDLERINLRGELMPPLQGQTQSLSESLWRAFVAYQMQDDPVITLETPEGEEVGTYYAEQWNLSLPDMLAGRPDAQRWRISLTEYVEGEAVTPLSELDAEAGTGDSLPPDILPEGFDI